MNKRPIVFATFLVMLFLLTSCWGQSDNEQVKDQEKEVDKFYTETGGWDWIRVPLIKPYEAKKIDPKLETNGWGIKLQSKLFQIDKVKKIDVQDSVIFILSGKIDNGIDDITAIGTLNVPTAWFVIDVKAKTEKGFSSASEFDKYLQSNNYPKPHWQDIDSISKMLGNRGQVPWIPK